MEALKILSCFHLIYSRLFIILSIPPSFLPCNFCPTLTVNSHHKRWRAQKSVASPKWMLQIITAYYIFRTSWVLDWRLRRRVWQLLYHILKPKHDISSSVFSLVLEFGFSRLSKVYKQGSNISSPRILANFTALKEVSASAIRTITKLVMVHKLWVEYFFAYRGHLFMFLIRESCYGRQRISLKIVINSRVRFIARLSPHTCQSV